MSILDKYQMYKEENGFTLLELIVTLTILTMIVVLTFSTIRIGIKAWETGDERVDFFYRMKYLVDLMEKEIHSIHPHYVLTDSNKKEKRLAFKGLQNSISFISSLDGNDPSSTGGLREVSFYLGKNGKNNKKGLIMTEKIIRTDRPFNKTKQKKARSIVLSPDVNHIKFKYYKLNNGASAKSNYNGEWLDNFTSDGGNLIDTNLPRAIEVTLGIETQKKGINKEIESFYLPPSIILLNAGMEFRFNKREEP